LVEDYCSLSRPVGTNWAISADVGGGTEPKLSERYLAWLQAERFLWYLVVHCGGIWRVAWYRNR
jgi:hypothetical protein